MQKMPSVSLSNASKQKKQNKPSGVAHPAQHDGHEEAEFEDEDDTGNAQAENNEEADDHALAVWCWECETWLNGPRQWEDHKIGKKHRKNVQKAKRGTSSSTEVAQPEAPQPVVDEEPEKKTAMWQWLEEGRVAKQAESNQLEGDGIQKEGRAARRRRHKQEKEAREAAEREDAAAAEAGEAPGMVAEPEPNEDSEPKKPKDTEQQKDVDVAPSDVSKFDKPIKVVPPREEFVGKSVSNP